MTKVITYGTFDLLHYGHINLLKRAKALGDYLIVGVTSPEFDVTRGKLNVHDDLDTRIKNVKSLGIADEIIVETHAGQKIEDIQKYNIDIFTVGSDWEGKMDYIKRYCKVVYLPRTEGISSTQLRSDSGDLNFTVGPVMMDPKILTVSSKAAPYFRNEWFSKIVLENEKMMLQALNAPSGSRCAFLTTSGTGAMESVVANLISSDDSVLVINGGSFGKRFSELCAMHSKKYAEIKVEFGHQITEAQLNEFSGKGYTVLLVNMDETSSGTLYDMTLISEFCKKQNIMLIIDAISAFISDEIDMTILNAAAVITSSQKALALHPGLAIVTLSPEAIQKLNTIPDTSMYLSLRDALANGERGQTPFTPAVTLLLELHERLILINENGGIAAERNKIHTIAENYRSLIQKFDLEVVSEAPSNAVTALRTKKHNAKAIIELAKTQYHIYLCPNGGMYADDIFRVGHIGYITTEDIRRLHSLMTALHEKGYY